MKQNENRISGMQEIDVKDFEKVAGGFLHPKNKNWVYDDPSEEIK